MCLLDDGESQQGNNNNNDNAEAVNMFATDEFCNDKEGILKCHEWRDMGYCEESKGFLPEMQSKCAHTCGFCTAPAGKVPFQILGRDCQEFELSGNFYGHFQLKEGSTMSSGTLLVTLQDASMWTLFSEEDVF